MNNEIKEEKLTEVTGGANDPGANVALQGLAGKVSGVQVTVYNTGAMQGKVGDELNNNFRRTTQPVQDA